MTRKDAIITINVYCGVVKWGWLNVRGKTLGAAVNENLATRFDSIVEAMIYALAFTRHDWIGYPVRYEQRQARPLPPPKTGQLLLL